jgi:hypothetical protein
VRRLDPGTGKANLCAHLALDAAASLHCNLVVGTACGSRDRWVVITSEPPTLAVFELYRWRFQIEGRKRHIVVDSQGLVLGVLVTEANLPERLRCCRDL